MSKIIIRLVTLFILLLPVIYLFRDVLLPASGKIIYGGDLLTQFYYWKGYLAESIKAGIIPFWNPYNFAGTPFLAHPAIAFLYPGTLLFLLLPLNSAFSWFYFIHFIIAVFGMYLLVRIYSGKFPAMIGAIAYILGGYFSARIFAGHVDILSTSVWIPWVVWSALNIYKNDSRRSLLFFIIFLSLEILAGYSALVLFTVELIVIFTGISLFWKLKRCEKISLKPLLTLISGIILSVGLTTVAWLPTYQFVRNSIRGNGLSYDLASWGSLPVSALKLYFFPTLTSELNKLSYGLGGYGIANFFDYFPGKVVLIVLVLITFVFIINRRLKKRLLGINLPPRDFWIFLLTVPFFIWVSFGYFVHPNLHYLLYSLLPLYRNIRIPAQHLSIIAFIIPLLFALSISRIKYSWLQLVIVILLLVELLPYDKKFFFLTQTPDLVTDRQLVDQLKTIPNFSRILPDYSVISPVLSVFDLNASMKYHLQSLNGYDPMIINNYYRFIDIVNGNKTSSIPYKNVEIPEINTQAPLFSYLNVSHILTESSVNLISVSDNGNYRELTHNSLYRLYSANKSTDRFFLTGKMTVMQNDDSVTDNLLTAKDNLLSETVLITENERKKINSSILMNCQRGDKAVISALNYSPNLVTFDINSPCTGILSSSEVYYPQWRAKIDNIETPVTRSNLAFRSIVVPRGNHKIIFYYSADIYIIGSILSILTVFTAGLIFIFSPYFDKLKLKGHREV